MKSMNEMNYPFFDMHVISIRHFLPHLLIQFNEDVSPQIMYHGHIRHIYQTYEYEYEFICMNGTVS